MSYNEEDPEYGCGLIVLIGVPLVSGIIGLIVWGLIELL